MRTFIWIVITFFCLTASLAFELNGSMVDTGSQDTYVVTLENDDGHMYQGTAVDIGEGMLKVDVTDGEGEFFNGSAQFGEDGDYHLSLKNVQSGDVATGELEKY